MVWLWAIYKSKYAKLNENIEFSGAFKEKWNNLAHLDWTLIFGGVQLPFTVDSLNNQLENIIWHQCLFMIVYEIKNQDILLQA